MKGEKIVCPGCGLYCALKKGDRIVCMGNGSCRYDSKKDKNIKKKGNGWK